MQQIELWMLIPFAVMLLGIAIFPLVAEEWWRRNRNMFGFVMLLSVPTYLYMAYIGLGDKVIHQMLYDYLPFIILLTALFAVTGGIHIRFHNMRPTPLVNAVLLLIGFNIASFIGTTGAAMLLIRPLLEINKSRHYRAHTVCFFIAMVANCGGVLSPLGDPPLFLLYLRGAPFEWFIHMFPEWAVVGVLLMMVYVVTDIILYRRELRMAAVKPEYDAESDDAEAISVSVSGAINIFYVIGIVSAVAFLNSSYIPAMGEPTAPVYIKFLREIVLVAIIALSMLTTKKSVRKANGFDWDPIEEVAILFIGIFATMTPALLYLGEHAQSLGLHAPYQFFYATGLLSSFLDNAPTAVAFHEVAAGLPVGEGADMVASVPSLMLRAISLGAVFFGAMTYIGNGPNFMVKAIAERDGVKMPSFFGYMVKFSLVVLLPIYIVAQLIFL